MEEVVREEGEEEENEGKKIRRRVRGKRRSGGNGPP